jgi:hypothetical protein
MVNIAYSFLLESDVFFIEELFYIKTEDNIGKIPSPKNGIFSDIPWFSPIFAI